MVDLKKAALRFRNIFVPRGRTPFGQHQGLLKHRKSEIHRFPVKYDKSDWLTRDANSAHAQKIVSGLSGRECFFQRILSSFFVYGARVHVMFGGPSKDFALGTASRPSSISAAQSSKAGSLPRARVLIFRNSRW